MTKKVPRRDLFRIGAGVVRAVWGNLRDVKDIGEAIRTLTSFGQPQAL